MNNSRLFWITGLSGSGKTTFAKKLIQKLNTNTNKAVLLDGDVVREMFDNTYDYSHEARLKTAHQYSRISAFLLKNNIDVVCSTISLFHEVQEWNRKNITNYIEIFIKVEMDELAKRDNKKIYSRAKTGELKNIVGVDIEAEFPKNPDLVLNNISETDLELYASKALEISLAPIKTN